MRIVIEQQIDRERGFDVSGKDGSLWKDSSPEAFEDFKDDDFGNQETSYSLMGTDWAKWLSMDIDPTTLSNYSEVDIICHCLWEMTFFGYSRYDQTKAREKPKSQRGISAFLCHSSADKAAVLDLAFRLDKHDTDPWLDELNLLPGQGWNLEIRRAIRASDVVIVILSRGSVSKVGYVQKEIRDALDVALEQPEGAIYIIPVRLEECAVPEQLRRWHWINLFEPTGFSQLMRALRERATSLGLYVPRDV